MTLNRLLNFEESMYFQRVTVNWKESKMEEFIPPFSNQIITVDHTVILTMYII